MRERNLFSSLIDISFITDCSIAYKKDNFKSLQNAYDDDISSESESNNSSEEN
jgi:hypothetical protein